ncbi:DUF300-domain-containing protein, partial [Aulographum hederae CBS 113979]
MPWPQCNNTINEVGDELVKAEKPLWKNFTFHHFGLFICACFGGLAMLIALWLIFQHATHYSKPWEQRHIIRILFMIPVYAVVSFLSYLFFTHAVYFEVIRDCYEAFAIAAFFTLMCHYLEPTLHDQKNYFRQLQPKNWVWPVNWYQKCTGGRHKGMFRIPKSGLTWFNIVWVCVFQYCFIRVFFTFVSLITEFFDRYCESSLSPAFARIWVQVFEGVSVTIAMYFLIQFYIQLRGDLAAFKPGLKILCIKLVIFFSFWQTMVISFLASTSGPLQPTATLAYPDIKVGIPSMLLCVEMAIFAVMHVFAFSAKPYYLSKAGPSDYPEPGVPGTSATKYHGGFLGVLALVDAFNPWDIIKASARGFRWLFVGVKHRKMDESYNKYNGSEDYDNDTGYHGGMSYASSGADGKGDSATELGVVGAKEDRTGLLNASQPPGYSPGPYQPYKPYE